MIGRLLRYVSGGDAFHECRSCGTTVESPDDPCPECGSNDIARYRLQ